MAIAPQVYNMRRGGGGFGRVLRGAAKGALAAGALAGACFSPGDSRGDG